MCFFALVRFRGNPLKAYYPMDFFCDFLGVTLVAHIPGFIHLYQQTPTNTHQKVGMICKQNAHISDPLTQPKNWQNPTCAGYVWAKATCPVIIPGGTTTWSFPGKEQTKCWASQRVLEFKVRCWYLEQTTLFVRCRDKSSENWQSHLGPWLKGKLNCSLFFLFMLNYVLPLAKRENKRGMFEYTNSYVANSWKKSDRY